MLGTDVTTYIYLNEKGVCVHRNACGGAIGREYEHDKTDWQPPEDWPYKVKDLRKPNHSN